MKWGQSETKYTHLKEQHRQLGFIELSESEPFHLLSFSYISYQTHVQDRRDTHVTL